MLLSGVALVLAGCAESTTQKEVAKAKQNLREEQQETREAVREAQQNVAEAQQDARTVNKPVVDNEAMADAQRKVNEAERKGAERIADQREDEREAAAKLQTKERELAATRARDTFVGQAEQQLAQADQQIEQLEAQAKASQGAAKDALDQKIKAVKLERDNAKSALAELKRADLDKWDLHRATVQSALQDLMRDLNANR
jgi:colicin import membrane protein